MKKIYPYFSQNPLDRLDSTRRNPKEVEKLKASSNTKFILFDNDKVLFDKQTKNCFFSNIELDTTDAILLGRENDINYFVLNKPIYKNTQAIPLREFANSSFLKKEKLGIIAQASAILNWHNNHKYCSFCGNKTLMKHAGWRRDCISCERQHFPRVDPVVIMLVTYGQYCLVGRGVNFPKNRYSCLAGYMESGETIEDASRRELFEEAGVIGLDVKYKLSQPWPFPSTLMIGVHVKAKSQKLTIDKHEIADAKWIHKDDIKKILHGDESFGFSIPSKIAVARNLLEIWVS
jgi:NAD+ diphosphatase